MSSSEGGVTKRDDEKEDWEETWDPMDVCTPLVTFQPYDSAIPALICANNDFDLVYPEYIGEDDSLKFEPDVTDDNIWDPSGD